MILSLLVAVAVLGAPQQETPQTITTTGPTTITTTGNTTINIDGGNTTVDDEFKLLDYIRVVGGYQGAIGHSAVPKGQYYFGAFGETPIVAGLWTWGSVDIAAAPRQVDIPIGTFIAD